MAGGGEPPDGRVEQAPSDAVAMEGGINVQRVDVRRARLRVAIIARTDVGEPDDTFVAPGHDHLAAVVRPETLAPDGELDSVVDRRDGRVGDGERPGVKRSDRLGVRGRRGVDDDGTDHLTSRVLSSRPVV